MWRAAGTGDTSGEFRTDGVEQRAETVIEEVGGDAARVVPILAPAEEALGVEGTLRGVPQEALPEWPLPWGQIAPGRPDSPSLTNRSYKRPEPPGK